MKDLPWTLLADLRCPCCGSRFQATLELVASNDGLQDGVLRCDCYEYPVVQGIAVVRQMSPVSSTHNGAVECLRHGDARGALLWLLAAGTAPGVPRPTGSSTSAGKATFLIRKIRNRFQAKPASAGEDNILPLKGLEPMLQASRPQGYAEYLYHRFANPSFLGAIPPLVVLGDICCLGARKRLLDLPCGVGHTSATLRALCPDVDVIMADIDYVNLFIARRCLAPDATALCLDAELPLPFSDDALDALFCLDGLHYVRSKVALLKEADRVTGDDGVWLFAHMHNLKIANINPGTPLDARGYSRRFSFGQQRMLPEAEVLRQFRDEGSLDLTHQASMDSLDSSNAFMLMGARKEKFWKRYTGLDEALFRRPDLLALNPLYRFEKAADGLDARTAWPSGSLQTECTGNTPLFRETVHLSSRTLHELSMAQSGETLSDDVRALLRSSMVVSLPTCYPRANLSLH